jgi:hypothetical protein
LFITVYFYAKPWTNLPISMGKIVDIWAKSWTRILFLLYV